MTSNEERARGWLNGLMIRFERNGGFLAEEETVGLTALLAQVRLETVVELAPERDQLRALEEVGDGRAVGSSRPPSTGRRTADDRHDAADRVQTTTEREPVTPTPTKPSRPLVIIESPFASPNGDLAEADRNLRYLRAALADCLQRGEAPFASHAIYPQPGVLRDEVPEERERSIQAGFAWRPAATRTVVYIDFGISDGMKKGIDDAKAILQVVEYRNLPGWAPTPEGQQLEFERNAWQGKVGAIVSMIEAKAKKYHADRPGSHVAADYLFSEFDRPFYLPVYLDELLREVYALLNADLSGFMSSEHALAALAAMSRGWPSLNRGASDGAAPACYKPEVWDAWVLHQMTTGHDNFDSEDEWAIECRVCGIAFTALADGTEGDDGTERSVTGAPVSDGAKRVLMVRGTLIEFPSDEDARSFIVAWRSSVHNNDPALLLDAEHFKGRYRGRPLVIEAAMDATEALLIMQAEEEQRGR